MALTGIFSLLINIAFIQARTEVGSQAIFKPDNYTHFDVYASALSKAHYSPYVCDYRSEPGYKCLTCSSALHCYPANFALYVQCAGMFPYCRNGYCSRFKTNGCTEDTEPNLASETTMPPYVQMFPNRNKTTVAPSVSVNSQITEPILHDSKPHDNSKPVKKPKDSIDINDEINLP